jgi:hypothetical protein
MAMLRPSAISGFRSFAKDIQFFAALARLYKLQLPPQSFCPEA